MFWQRPASLSGQILIGNWELSKWPCFQFSISQSRVLLPPAWPDIVIAVSPDSDVNYLSIWTQVRRRRRGPDPRLPRQTDPRLVGLGDNNTHYNHDPLFSRHHESAELSGEILQQVWILKILRHLRSEEPGSEFVWAMGGPAPLIWTDTDLSLLSRE